LIVPIANQRYVYGNGDPVGGLDPSGLSDTAFYGVSSARAVPISVKAVDIGVRVAKAAVVVALAVSALEIAEAVRKQLKGKYGHIDRFSMCWLNVVKPWLDKAIEDIVPQAEGDPIVFNLTILGIYQAAELMLKECMASGGGGN
jgi:hypothetical protein